MTRKITPILALAVLLLCSVISSQAFAVNYLWDGGSGNWEDANWSGGGSIVDINDPVTYSNDTFTINDGSVDRAGQITFGSGSGGATMNVGGTGTWNYNENDQLELRQNGALNISGNGVVNLNNATGDSLDTGNGSFATFSGNGKLLADFNLDIFFTTININDSSYVSAERLFMRNPSTNPTIINFNGGTVDLLGNDASNPLRATSGAGASGQATLNFTGESGVLRLPNATNGYLLGKLTNTFVRIDGADPGGTGSGNSVNGKYFDNDVDGSLVLVDSGTYREQVLTGANPLAYYRAEEIAGATRLGDYSGHTNDVNGAGNINGTTSGATGLIGNALSFDGTSNFVDTPVNLDVAANSFTIEMLVNPSSISGNTLLVQQLDGTGTGRSLLFLGGNGSLRSFYGGSTTNTAGGLINLGEWAHVAVTVTQSGTNDIVDLYINGLLAGTGTEDGETVDGIWRIGADKSGNNKFAGLLDEIAFYDRALSAAEIAAHADAANLLVPEPASVALWSVMALALACLGWCRRRMA